MSGQGREEKGLFPKGMILACVILFLLGIGCVVQKFLNKWTIFLFCSILFSSNQKEH